MQELKNDICRACMTQSSDMSFYSIVDALGKVPCIFLCWAYTRLCPPTVNCRLECSIGSYSLWWTIGHLGFLGHGQALSWYCTQMWANQFQWTFPNTWSCWLLLLKFNLKDKNVEKELVWGRDDRGWMEIRKSGEVQVIRMDCVHYEIVIYQI